MAVFAPFVSAGQVESPIKFPSDYRAAFNWYLCLDQQQDPEQIVYFFANEIAMQGPGPDGALPYGSVIVEEVYRAKKDADGNVRRSSLGKRIKGPMIQINVIERRSGWGDRHPPELANADWEYAVFNPDGTPADRNLMACRACHGLMVNSNHLFSYDHFR